MGNYLDGYAKEVCGHCNHKRTPEGYDGCIGNLPNVMNACCGHGEETVAYVQFNHVDFEAEPNKKLLKGSAALAYIEENRQNKQIKTMKTYIITISKTFLKDHPRAGEKTNFSEAYASEEKIHTIRTNFAYWKNIVEEVNQGNAYLSVREWEGKPYRSKQKELGRHYELGYQSIEQNKTGFVCVDSIHTPVYSDDTFAHNDGLELEDFYSWFHKPLSAGIIIHFTDFRY